MFMTSVLPGGATFTGVSGADLLCNSDAGRPSVLPTYKALIASSSGTIRRASVTANAGDGQVDWVLQPSMQYRRSDGVTVVGTTGTNSLFAFNLTNSPLVSGAYWTGLNGSWQNAADCGGWTFSGTALLGNGAQTTNASISAAGQNCNFAGFGLLCIEQ